MTTGSESLLAEAKNLFEYLAQVQRVREKPVRTTRDYESTFWFKDFPDHGAVRSADRDADPAADAQILTVDRVVRVDAPPVSDELAHWLVGDVKDPDAMLELRESVLATLVPDLAPRASFGGQSNVVLLEDEPQIREAFNNYLAEWNLWIELDRHDKPARELYTDLFAAQQMATSHSESYELVLGVGAVSWAPEDHDAVQRHLMTFPARLSFDESTGRLTLEREGGVIPLSIELDMLDPALVSRQVSDLRGQALQYDGHPLNRDLVGLEITRFAHALDPQGAYLDDDAAAAPGRDLRAAFAPALILRRRSQRGLIDMFDTIRLQLEESGEVPPGLLPLIDPDYRPESIPDDSPGGIVEIDDETFLPMPVNDRQLKVIQAVNGKSQVVVQGPPGTGKTHTSAALLSHLLAQGKRVLVTAHTDRALQEVRDKLPREIRPLSVAVVGSSQAEMADLRVAVETISSKADEYDRTEAARSMSRHAEAIDRLRRERAETYTALRTSREAETKAQTAGSYTGTLAAIAQAIGADAPTHGWLAELVQNPISSAPLSNREALELLGLINDPAVAADERESETRFPELTALPDAEAFARLVDGEATASAHARTHASWRDHPLFADVESLDDNVRRALHERTSELAKALDDLEARSEGWVAEAVHDIRSGRRQTWQSRSEQVASLIEQARPYVLALGLVARVVAPSEQLPSLSAMARSLHAHVSKSPLKLLADGSPRIGALTPKVVKQCQPFFESVRLNGLPATSSAHLESFLHYADGTQILDGLDRAWPATVTIPEEDTLDERLQWHVTELGQLIKVLAMADRLAATEEWMLQHNLKAPNWSDLEDVTSYAKLVDAAMSADALDVAQTPLVALESEITQQAAWTGSSPVVHDLASAITQRDRNAYLVAINRLAALHAVRAKVDRRDQLVRQLSASAPEMAGAMVATREDQAWPDRLEEFEAAWSWLAARTWLSSQETADVNGLQRRLNSVEAELRQEIEALAAERAWSHAVDESRMSGTARAHLRQYAALVRRLGRGTGKYAAKQRQEIKEALDQCRPTVPVWIMPIYRIAEQFRISADMFDVVLVDEASQAGLEAAFLQYLAPKIVVVGDDKQVSPTAVGVDQQHLRDLANQYLANNPFKASWQDPKRSYFDEATMRFGGKITLIEHRRCVPEIIGFSNKIAYEPDNIRLIPVRQRPSDALTPIRRVHVADGYERGRGINPAEADAIVEQVIACAADPAYAGRTFGVISLMGKEQAKYIAGLLLGRLTPEEWTTHDLRCGDAADFQGSERDVIFLSMVKAADGGRLGALTQEMYVQRYNVAASRAKDQMWLFHSMLLSDLGNPEDMRHALLDYVTNVETRQDETDDRIRTDLAPEDFRIQPFDSLFEQRVFNRIHGRGYSVIPQYPAEGYNIDLVVVGGNGNLAIECDGDTWHGPEHYLKDLARQRDLERCGWTFFRVRESAYYLDPDAALADLWGKLDDLNREPEAVEVIANATPSAPSRDRQPNIELTTIEASGAGSAPAPTPAPEAIALDHAPAPASAISTTTEAPTVDVVAPPVDQPSSSRYGEFTGRTTPTHLASKGQIIDSVVEVVRAEGPVRGSRLLTAYVRAAGGQKVGSQIAHDLNSAITAAVRQGRLIEDNPLNEPGVKGKTYRLPDQPPFLIRGLGQRSLDDVPPLELAARIELARRRVGPHASREELFRAVLDRLGLKRLTPNVEDLLTRAAGIRVNGADAE